MGQVWEIGKRLFGEGLEEKNMAILQSSMDGNGIWGGNMGVKRKQENRGEIFKMGNVVEGTNIRVHDKG